MALAKAIGRAGRGLLLAAAVLCAVAVAGGQAAETDPPPAAQPSAPAPAAAPPASAPDAAKPSGDVSTAQDLTLQARPVALPRYRYKSARIVCQSFTADNPISRTAASLRIQIPPSGNNIHTHSGRATPTI